ncbi:four helix bundle protein [Dokdonia ponticola]|uniref:Four helix bundle protein n=1 Tax=Dokdonia ponticola TaxID=2041041 RepID=A0ABV9I524_9FLAO
MMDKTTFINAFKRRTKTFAGSIVLFYDKLPKDSSTQVMGKQLIRSATSTAANYRAACIARSDREFYAKLSITVEEADETLFWLELFEETKKASLQELQPLMDEALEILKVLGSARRNSKNKN